MEELRQQGRLDDIGGAAYITYLINHTPSSIYAEAYGRIVERAAIRRRLLAAASEIAQLAHEESADINEVIDRSEASLFAVTERRLRKELVPINIAISDYYDRIEHLYEHRGEPLGVPSGFVDLDRLLGGCKSRHDYRRGRPGSGKTSGLLSVALTRARGRACVLQLGNEQREVRAAPCPSETGSARRICGSASDTANGHCSSRRPPNYVRAHLPRRHTGAVPDQMRSKCRRCTPCMASHLIMVIICSC